MFVPDEYLNSLYITYYPDRMWGITFPIYMLFLIVISIIFYNCISILNVRPPNSFDLIMDESTKYMDLSLLYKFDDLELIRSICKSTLDIYTLANKDSKEKVTEGSRTNNESKYRKYLDAKSMCIKEVFSEEGITLDLVHLNNEIGFLQSNKRTIPIADLPLPLVCEMIYSDVSLGT